MVSVKSNNRINPLIFIFQILFTTITFSSFGQTKQSYRNHEEIEIGGGMKVEILKCVGEGPTEECDCIYFSDKRQNGTRMRQNADVIKEQERAAFIAKGTNNAPVRKNLAAAITENRADKAIPEFIKPKPYVPKGPTLEEIARHADSIARIHAEKVNESVARSIAIEDSIEMNNVNNPLKTPTGGTTLVNGSPAKLPETNLTSADTARIVEKTPKAATSNTSSTTNQTSTPPSPPVAVVVIKKDTVANIVSAQSQTTTAPDAQVEKKADRVAAVNSTNPIKVSDIVQSRFAVSVKDTIATKAQPDSIEAITDTADNHWTKKYEGVKPTSGINQPGSNTAWKSEGRTEKLLSTTIPTAANTKAQNGVKASGTGVMNSPEMAGKSIKGEEKKAAKSNLNAAVNLASANKNLVPTPASATADAAKMKTEEKAETVVKMPIAETTKIEPANNAILNTGNALETKLANIAATPEKSVIGKTAEVSLKGVWEKATILEKESEYLYKVHYRGTSSDHDEWVAVSQIRNIDSASSTSVKPTGPSKNVNVNCSFEAPAPPFSNAAQFSEKIAKRKIYENYLFAKKGNNSAKTGLTFLSFKMEEPYVNTVSITAANALEVKLSIAPSGAMIYPVKTQFKVCEQMSGKTSSSTVVSNFACFRNKQGEWTCTNVE